MMFLYYSYLKTLNEWFLGVWSKREGQFSDLSNTILVPLKLCAAEKYALEGKEALRKSEKLAQRLGRTRGMQLKMWYQSFKEKYPIFSATQIFSLHFMWFWLNYSKKLKTHPKSKSRIEMPILPVLNNYNYIYLCVNIFSLRNCSSFWFSFFFFFLNNVFI